MKTPKFIRNLTGFTKRTFGTVALTVSMALPQKEEDLDEAVSRHPDSVQYPPEGTLGSPKM